MKKIIMMEAVYLLIRIMYVLITNLIKSKDRSDLGYVHVCACVCLSSLAYIHRHRVFVCFFILSTHYFM